MSCAWLSTKPWWRIAQWRYAYTRIVWKIRGLTLLLRIGPLRRWSDGLFSRYLHWQAMRFLQRSTHLSKTCCRPFAASFRRIVEQAVLTSELPFHGWKSPEIARGEIWAVWGMFWWGCTNCGERIHCNFSTTQRWRSIKGAQTSRKLFF
jgi:hypothetical protein